MTLTKRYVYVKHVFDFNSHLLVIIIKKSLLQGYIYQHPKAACNLWWATSDKDKFLEVQSCGAMKTC